MGSEKQHSDQDESDALPAFGVEDASRGPADRCDLCTRRERIGTECLLSGRHYALCRVEKALRYRFGNHCARSQKGQLASRFVK